MGAPTERELKLALESAADHRRVLDALGSHDGASPEPGVVQINHYFDAVDLRLARQGRLLRVRECGGRCVLTYKDGGEDPEHPGFFESLELEAEISPELLQGILLEPCALLGLELDPIQALRASVSELELVLLGASCTTRSVRRLGPYRLEVDAVEFPDGSGAWEIEVETDDPDGARLALEELLGRIGVAATPQRSTKLEQMLRRAGRLGGGRG